MLQTAIRQGMTQPEQIPGAEQWAQEEFRDLYEHRDENFGNARDVRNLFESIIARQANRLAAMEAPTKEDLMTILPDDLAPESPSAAMLTSDDKEKPVGIN